MILNEATRSVTWNGATYGLTPVQTAILSALRGTPTQTTTELAVRVYGEEYGKTRQAANNLHQQLHYLRQRVPGLVESQQTAVHRLGKVA